MRHDFLDKYSDGDGPLHRIDARWKAAAVAVMLLGVNILRAPPCWIPATAGTLLLAALAVARVPVFHILKRGAAALPFALILGAFLPFTVEGKTLLTIAAGPYYADVTGAGLRLYATLIVKAYLSLALVALLMAVTPFPKLLRALKWYRAPAFFLDLLAFTYRFIFILIEEAERLERGWACRYFGRRPVRQFLTLGPAIAALFIRSYERAERVWGAMLARGYDPGTP